MNTIHRFVHAPFVLLIASALTGCDNQSATTPSTPAPPASDARKDKPLPRRDVVVQKTSGNLTPDAARPTTEPVDPPVVSRRVEEEEKEVPPEKDPPIPDGLKPLNKEKTIFFEKTADDKRRVYVLASVCLREGPLEVLLCKAGTKEHEAILTAELDARELHVALIAAGGKPGATVRFNPKYQPATGDVVRVSVTYHKDGKLITRPAQEWVQDFKTKKAMTHDWVFAGSRLFQDPDDLQKPPYYCANNGEVVSIANFGDALLDLPIPSSKENAELAFGVFTERIPPLKTKVLVMFEVVKGN